jgi:hypothetical protein
LFKPVKNFQELLTTRFADGVNALCWSRSLPGDYAEVVRLLGPGEGIVALEEERLRGLGLSGKGKEAVEQMLADLALLRDAGRDPVLNIIYGYRKDEDSSDAPPGALAKGGPIIARDVMSWHVDSAPIEADTWLCTYHGAPSEGLPNEHAIRKVDDPTIRSALLKQYGGTEGEDFSDWLTENHYDLHYAPKSGAQPYSFGQFNLWRATCAWPGSPVPPCVHRAPDVNTPRLLLIS